MAGRRGKRVAIIGAGPGGLTAALAFWKVGFDVTVYERSHEVRSIGGGIALWPPPIKALEILGVGPDSLGAVSDPRFIRPSGKLVAAYPTVADSEIDVPLWIGAMRTTLYEQMLAQLPASVIETGKRCTAVRQDDAFAYAQFDDGTVVEADLILGADGLHSVVRQYFEGDKPVRDNHLTLWLGHTFESFPDRSQTRMVMDPRGYQCSYTPMTFQGRPGYHWWVMERRDSTTPLLEGAEMKAHIMSIVKDIPQPLPAMIEGTPLESIFPWVIRDREPLATWVDRRIAVLGDAAHATNPYAGYGAGMAVVDGFYLACAFADVDLGDTAAVSAVLAQYEADRKPETDAVVAFAYMMGQLMHTPNKLKALSRDLLLDRTPFLRKQLAKQYGEPLTAAFRMVVELGKRMPAARENAAL
ncbi:FAD-dependent oxidoreductase [Microbacterium sp. E-13]|uniref:FAD-dependent oxidoreductase n=1 Tax=Microbacterium sp. E-13 TaxID=3404048 RepID=UPI003CF5A7BC